MSLTRLAAMGGVAALQLLSCGGDDPVDPCPTGDCTVDGATVVKFLFNSYPDWKFIGDTCLDLGVFHVQIEAVNVIDPAIRTSKQAQCGEGQVTFLGLPPGMYDVAVTPLDAGGDSVVRAPGTGQAIAAERGARTEATVNVPYTAWTSAFTGTLLFRLAWDGVTCAAATPAVAMQTLELTAGGGVVSQRTDSGQKLDGSEARPCRALTEQFAQFAEELPFGPASLFVVGHDGEGELRFQHRFETFIGAGKNNPTITFDVPPPDAGMPPDAPIDAAPDAPIDAAPDAMIDAAPDALI